MTKTAAPKTAAPKTAAPKTAAPKTVKPFSTWEQVEGFVRTSAQFALDDKAADSVDNHRDNIRDTLNDNKAERFEERAWALYDKLTAPKAAKASPLPQVAAPAPQAAAAPPALRPGQQPPKAGAPVPARWAKVHVTLGGKPYKVAADHTADWWTKTQDVIAQAKGTAPVAALHAAGVPTHWVGYAVRRGWLATAA